MVYPTVERRMRRAARCDLEQMLIEPPRPPHQIRASRLPDQEKITSPSSTTYCGGTAISALSLPSTLPARSSAILMTGRVSSPCGGYFCSARPFRKSAVSSSDMTDQLDGISPSSDSSNPSGNSAAVSASIPTGCRPSVLARTGSKSTNQDLKIARAMASSVSFMRRLSSILSSRVPRMWAMARCSGRGGTRTVRWCKGG